ncbi:MAG TPA: glycoside hydrolase family 19 protein [Anaerolineales bacterium]|nr:glycoside hydrolase family 19 protein [Anaerolineales bacterium]
MDRKVFYDKVRGAIFRGGISQKQLDGMQAVLDEWEARYLQDRRWLAYMLATDYHETAHRMEAIREYGKGRGRKYGVRDAKTGHVYYGRGLVQLTWARNYKTMGQLLELDLYGNPDLALQLPVAVQIMFEGMLRGSFTGKKLADYFTESKTDWINARRIINGTDKATLIAGYARKFHAALVAASEPLKSPQALTRSRTMAMAGVATASGVGKTGFDAITLYDTATQADGYISRGDIFGMAFGAALILGGLYVAYARWDDAGRPSFREVIKGWN